MGFFVLINTVGVEFKLYFGQALDLYNFRAGVYFGILKGVFLFRQPAGDKFNLIWTQ
uniref:Uncharacterized protein n=1 Tax=Lepeophtheirus salmonis TaxID=72036 RepID=A0A0K2TGV4_LEPSM